MEALSITASCISLAGAISKLSRDIASFIRTFRDAREDLTAVAGDLTRLNLTLDLLGDESQDDEDTIPGELRIQVQAILSDCKDTMDRLGDHRSK